MPRLTKDEIDRNVLRPKFGDKAITTGHVAGVRICFHEFVVIIPDTEQVFCRTCKEEIDAFHVLRKLARVWDNVTYAQRELEELHRRAEEAKREAANARNRIRGAIKRAPESKAEHYRAELVRRLDAANNQGEIHDAHEWARNFRWLDPDDQEAVRVAYERAQLRAKESARKNSKARQAGVKVISGGKA